MDTRPDTPYERAREDILRVVINMKGYRITEEERGKLTRYLAHNLKYQVEDHG